MKLCKEGHKKQTDSVISAACSLTAYPMFFPQSDFPVTISIFTLSLAQNINNCLGISVWIACDLAKYPVTLIGVSKHNGRTNFIV